jgi:hypothetical protein
MVRGWAIEELNGEFPVKRMAIGWGARSASGTCATRQAVGATRMANHALQTQSPSGK